MCRHRDAAQRQGAHAARDVMRGHEERSRSETETPGRQVATTRDGRGRIARQRVAVGAGQDRNTESEAEREMIQEADQELKGRWLARFHALSPEAREALRDALLELPADSAMRAEHAWRKRKAPMALYHRVVSVYAGHIARALGAAGRERDTVRAAGRLHTGGSHAALASHRVHRVLAPTSFGVVARVPMTHRCFGRRGDCSGRTRSQTPPKRGLSLRGTGSG